LVDLFESYDDTRTWERQVSKKITTSTLTMEVWVTCILMLLKRKKCFCPVERWPHFPQPGHIDHMLISSQTSQNPRNSDCHWVWWHYFPKKCWKKTITTRSI